MKALRSPFVGLVPFSEADSSLFFGRERERKLDTDSLLAFRLSLRYGPSGVGKSSFLHAAVAHDLIRLAHDNIERRGAPEFAVVVFNGPWHDEPVSALLDAVRSSVGSLLGDGGPPSEGSLDVVLEAWSERIGGDLLVILDQFEEYFLYHGHEDGGGAFGYELARAVNRPDLRANFLISIREDALAELDRLKGRISNLFDNSRRIGHLDPESARAAITGPIDVYNDLFAAGLPMRIEPALVDAVLDHLRAGRIFVGGNDVDTFRGSAEREGRVETAHLQLVMSRLWQEETSRGSRVLRVGTLMELGGAQRIVSAHVDDALNSLTCEEQDIAAHILRYLVTSSGTKVAHTLSDLADFTGVRLKRVEAIANKLLSGNVRLLRPVASSLAPGEARVEIFHDVLAPAVLDWRARHIRARVEQDQVAQVQARRRYRIKAAAYMALAVTFMVGLIETVLHLLT